MKYCIAVCLTILAFNNAFADTRPDYKSLAQQIEVELTKNTESAIKLMDKDLFPNVAIERSTQIKIWLNEFNKAFERHPGYGPCTQAAWRVQTSWDTQVLLMTKGINGAANISALLIGGFDAGKNYAMCLDTIKL